ncbi:MAG: anthranilate phosphoribosyltransferase [Phycisphaerae bacterium]
MNGKEILQRLTCGETLGTSAARDLFNQIMDGAIPTELLCGILAAFATRGETVDELVGAALAMRQRVVPVRVSPSVNAIDTCGTGGDGKPTFNVSSAVAIVAAAAGATVAKHGNRSQARPSGSSEGLSALGIRSDVPVAKLEECLATCRVAFLFAPALHPAMRHAAPARQALGVRTIFNLVGPLTNPAGVRRQLLGVPRVELVPKMAEALCRLGVDRAMVVSGVCGLCDLSLEGPTHIARISGDEIVYEEVHCTIAGINPAKLDHIFVRSAAQSAEMIRSILAGEAGPPRDMVLLNAAAALQVAEIASDWQDGAARAREAIDSGRAAQTLEEWIAITRG